MIKVLAVIIVQKQFQKKITKSILIAPVETFRMLVSLADWYQLPPDQRHDDDENINSCHHGGHSDSAKTCAFFLRALRAVGCGDCCEDYKDYKKETKQCESDNDLTFGCG